VIELLLLLFFLFITYLVSVTLNPWVVCAKCQGEASSRVV